MKPFVEFPLRMSTLEMEGPLHASKWLTAQVLLDTDEMSQLLADLSDFHIFCGGSLTPLHQGKVHPEAFLEAYGYYLQQLRAGKLPKEECYRPRFYDFWTSDTESLFAIDVKGKQIVKATRPVIQLQMHQIGYSTVDKQFRPMVMGTSSIHWGLQFSYPQIFQDNRSKNIMKVDESPDFPNTHLFRQLQRWLRQHSVPTPFLVGEQRCNVPMRLGKNCFKWIRQHPQLKEKGISVAVPEANYADV